MTKIGKNGPFKKKISNYKHPSLHWNLHVDLDEVPAMQIIKVKVAHEWKKSPSKQRMTLE